MPGSSHPGAAAFRLITSFTIPDPYTLVLEMNPEDIFSLERSLGPYTGLGIVSKSYVEAVGRDQAAADWVGSGPWRHIQTQQGVAITFEAETGHCFKTPEFASLEVLQVVDQATQLAAIATGQADLANLRFDFLDNALSFGLQVLEVADGGTVKIKLGVQHLPSRALPDNPGCPDLPFDETCGEFNTDAAPWIADPNDPADWENALKVRKAMNLAIDKETIRQTIYGGVGRVSAIDSNTPSYDGVAFPPYPYDPEQARQLMAEAGYPDGFAMDLPFSLGIYSEDDAAQAVQQMWGAELGITVNLQPGVSDFPATVARTFGTSGPEASLRRLSSSYLETYLWAATTVSTTSYLSVAEHTTIDILTAAAGITFDPAARHLVNLEIQQFLYNNYLSVSLVFLPNLLMAGPQVGEYTYPFGGVMLPGVEFITKAP